MNYLEDIYYDLPYKTSEEIKKKFNIRTKKRIRANQFTIFILILWLSVIPASIAIGGFFNPFISITAFIYSIYKALTQALKLLGYRKKTIKEREKYEEERSMKHHHYHCKLNPVGFQKLVAENYEKGIIDENSKIKSQLENQQFKTNNRFIK